jgi:DNA processing protein
LTESAGKEACQQPSDNSQALKAWLICLRCPHLTSAQLRECLAHGWTPSRLLAAGSAELRQVGFSAALCDWLARPDTAQLEQDMRWLAQPSHQLLTLTDDRYPALLKTIPDPPPVLFVAGRPEALNEPQLAIVGSRNPTPQGQHNAREFARALAQAGLVITSGLASGIDSCAHSAAIEAGSITIAVLGTGPDIIYPAKNRVLAAKIIENGAIVSEFPPGTSARPFHFPQRNRIISGLSLGVLVVEAALRSGSLITARLAGAQGREVFALPGDRQNPMAKGCHRLIRQGAKLVEETRHILEELTVLADVYMEETGVEQSSGMPLPTNAVARRLFDHMGFGPVTVDELADRSGLTPGSVSSMLVVLELHGYIVSLPGGRYTRCQLREDS